MKKKGNPLNITWLKSAVADLKRLQEFILEHNPKASRQAAQKIRAGVMNLMDHSELGKPVDNLPEFRDLAIAFGAGGYVLRYRIHQNNIFIVHVRHYKENGFH